MPRPLGAARLAALLVLGIFPSAVWAQGYSADIELVRPTWSTGSLPGVDSPEFDSPGTVQGGFLFQYARDPLILYEENEEVGSLVHQRTTLQMGLSWEPTKNIGLRASIPAAIQWGSDLPEQTKEGALVGDLFVGGRVRVLDTKVFDLGLRGDVGIPSGSKDAWMGEAGFRGIFGPTMMATAYGFDALADIHFVGRGVTETPSDFTLGSELVTAFGLRYNIWPDRVAVGMSYIGRGGLGFIGNGGAENPSELLTNAQVRLNPDMSLEVGAGKGLADGYGTTEFRAFVGLTWIRHKPEPPPPEPVAIVEEPPEVPPDPPAPPEPEWEEDELAQIRGEQIVIRDPIEFEFNTPNILPKSLPTLQYVADLMNENWQIGHIVIEGHASEEGSFEYNYDLSIRRSRAIWEALIRAGAHPDRMSYRGMGETVPRTAGTDEGALAGNRRVEFKIIKQYGPNERPPEYRQNVLNPWNGDPSQVKTPVAPPPPPDRKIPEGTPRNNDLEDFFDKMEDSDPPDGGDQ